MFAVQADGANVTTIEGLAVDGKLHAMQEAFWNEHGAQCGFCTPGMIMASKQILDRNPHPTDEEIRHGPRRKCLPVHGVSAHRERGAGRGEGGGVIAMATTIAKT